MRVLSKQEIQKSKLQQNGEFFPHFLCSPSAAINNITTVTIPFPKKSYLLLAQSKLHPSSEEHEQMK